MIKYTLLFTVLCTFFACQNDTPPAEAEEQTAETEMVTAGTKDCVQRIIQLDEKLGAIRNGATEEQSLSAAITAYLEGAKEIDYTACPPELQPAMEQHLAAWENVIPVTDKYADRRGKMDALFMGLEKSPDSVAVKVFIQRSYDTWTRVNSVVMANM